MDFWAAMRVLRRRWYIALPALVLAAALAAFTYVSIPTRYESTGVMVLTSSASGGKESANPGEAVKINPLLAFDGSLTTTAQILTQILGDPRTRTQLGAGAGAASGYTAKNGDQNGPFVFVTVDGDTPQGSQELVGRILERAKQELADRQRALQAPESTFITSEVLVQPTEAEAQIGGKVRYAGAALVLLLLLTTAATFASDSIIENLKRRRAAPRAENSRGDEKTAPAGARGVDTVIVAVPDIATRWPTEEDHPGPKQQRGRTS